MLSLLCSNLLTNDSAGGWLVDNLDNWHGMDRYHYNSLVSKQDWADTYQMPFWAAVVGANASGLMCSCECLALPAAV
eukprot:SAG22_NODE_1148_length_5359_cov_2.946958_8_plen_77_part_00